MLGRRRADYWVLGAAILAACLGGCGGESASKSHNISPGEGGEGGNAAESSDPPGLSSLDATPRQTSDALTVVDAAGDRLLVSGDIGDVWALSLSGRSAGAWSHQRQGGELAEFRGAAYDAPRNRLLSLRTYGPLDENEYELRELPLEGALQGRRVVGNAAPVDGYASELFVLDEAAARLWMVRNDGAWRLDIEGEGAWTKVAEPTPEVPYFADPLHSLFYDAARERLLLFDPYTRWQLDLLSGKWSQLSGIEEWPPAQKFASYFLDSERERLLFVGGEYAELATLDLATDTMAIVEEQAQGPLYGARASFDRVRNRILYFSGLGPDAGNAVRERSLESLELGQVYESDRLALPAFRGRTLAWDFVRGALIDDESLDARTLARAPLTGASWIELPVSGSVAGEGKTTVYDALGAQIISFGGQGAASVTLLRSDASTWETLPVEGGPSARSSALSAFDAAKRRLLVHGGRVGNAFSSDTWLLQLGDETTWTQLEPSGEPPPERGYYLEGAYDPDGGRMLVVEMDRSGAYVPCTVRALSLDDDAPTWSVVSTDGEAPSLIAPSVAHDPSGHRLIVASSRVYALSLDGTPTWHQFCRADLPTLVDAIAVVPDGLFLAVGDAAFRLDLATPYCD